MPKWGYALIAALALALAAYAFWPEKSGGSSPFPDLAKQPFTVSGELGEQQIGKGRVSVAGMDRPADMRTIAGLSAWLARLQVAPDRVVEGVDASAARAWGVDGTHRLVVGSEERSWGVANGAAAVFDPGRRRAYLMDPDVVRRITSATARLDLRELVELEAMPAWISVDGVRLERGAVWSYPGNAHPPASGRVQLLLNLLRTAVLAGPGSAPADALAEHELRWPGTQGGEQRLRLLSAGGKSWLALDGAPPQEIGAEALAAWRMVWTALAEDRPCDPPTDVDPLLLRVRRAGTEVMRLERRGEPDERGLRPWTVVWPGGAEPAIEGAGEHVLAALAGTSFTAGSATRGEAPVSPDATTIEIAFVHDGGLQAVLAGGRLWSGGWSGTPSRLVPPLDALGPEAFFDPRPCRMDPERATKWQRRWTAEPSRDEIASRIGGGTWSRTWPKGATPHDSEALQRMVRSLCRLRARSVRFATPADLTHAAEVAIAVRFAPLQAARTTVEDEIELADTMPQERAWNLWRDGDAWSMAEVGGQLVFGLADADAGTLLADVTSDHLFPIAPALISAVAVGGKAPFRLERSGEGWILRREAATVPADALAVRRLLRAIGDLRVDRLDPGQKPPPVGSGLMLTVESAEGEHLTVVFHLGSGLTASTVRGTGALTDPTAWSQVELRPEAYLGR